MALCQHHDAITGTAKQHVVDDYHARLASGLCEAQQVVTNALAHLIQGKSLPAHLRGAAATACRAKQASADVLGYSWEKRAEKILSIVQKTGQ